LPTKTKILCTVGPSRFSEKTLQKMFKAGMKGARINTVYGAFDEYEAVI
jgi:pyruvate kinase